MTQRKKVIAVLLAVIFTLSALSAAFSVSAETQTCTVRIRVYGDGTVSDSATGVASSTEFVGEYVLGQSVKLTSTPGSGKEVIFWVNDETQRVLSFSDSYSFSAGSDMYLYIVFEDTAAAAAQQGVHHVVYLSEGDNIMYEETLPLGNTAYYENNVASLDMSSNGKIWTGWDKEPADVAADSGRVFVHPTYSESLQDKQFCTVTTIIGDASSWRKCEFDKRYSVSAPETLNGEPFSYWLVPRDASDPNSRDVIASYKREYSFVVVVPTTLRAVYGEDVTPVPVTRVVGDVPEMENSAITFYTEWDVTNDFTVVQAGLLATRDSGIGNLESAFVLNTGDSRIRNGKSNRTGRNDNYSVRISSWYSVKDGTTDEYYYPLIYIRSYVIVRDSAGVVTTLYSPIHAADYVNEAFVGVVLDNPNNDPFATNP